jgi:hypothetical protein
LHREIFQASSLCELVSRPNRSVPHPRTVAHHLKGLANSLRRHQNHQQAHFTTAIQLRNWGQRTASLPIASCSHGQNRTVSHPNDGCTSAKWPWQLSPSSRTRAINHCVSTFTSFQSQQARQLSTSQQVASLPRRHTFLPLATTTLPTILPISAPCQDAIPIYDRYRRFIKELVLDVIDHKIEPRNIPSKIKIEPANPPINSSTATSSTYQSNPIAHTNSPTPFTITKHTNLMPPAANLQSQSNLDSIMLLRIPSGQLNVYSIWNR